MIFDLGVNGNAATDPANWTFFFDEIEQVADCGIPVLAFPVDFEGDPSRYDFGANGGFGGGASSVVANPASGGDNTSAQVARMQKFAGEVFGGSTLNLGRNIDFAQGAAFTMKVRAGRAVPVLFKLEGADPSSQADDRERNASYGGSGDWEELCFNFTGDTSGVTSRAITFIFDLGVNGNADSDPANWTFYFDDIEQVDSCGGAAGPLFPVDFEGDAAQYNFGAEGGFGGGVSTVVANPAPGGINTSAQTARMQKFAGEVFAGSTLSLGGNVDFAQGAAFKLKVRATRAVPLLFKFEGLNQERTASHSGSGNWEELCFDFTGSTAGPPSNAITFIFDLGVAGDAASNANAWTFFYDDIEQVASCGGGGGGTPLGPVDFEPAGLGQGFTWSVFENGDNPPVTFLANPDSSGANTSATVARFTARQAGQPFAGTITSDLPTFTLSASNSCVKVKVWKTVISDVGIKFETGTQASSGEIKVANTLTNQWQELSFDFSTEDRRAVLDGHHGFRAVPGLRGARAGERGLFRRHPLPRRQPVRRWRRRWWRYADFGGLRGRPGAIRLRSRRRLRWRRVDGDRESGAGRHQHQRPGRADGEVRRRGVRRQHAGPARRRRLERRPRSSR